MSFQIMQNEPCLIYVGKDEPEAVKIASQNLRKDIGRVLGISAASTEDGGKAHIFIETLKDLREASQNRAELKALFDEKSAVRKEAYLLQVKEGRLFISGSDRRGTVYGIYELCRMLGVSPWHFFADVPVRKRQAFSLPDGFEKMDYPSVEYRGIFINDEEELEDWVRGHMGEDTIGVKTYEKVFELLLRLKGNYIWPAMHVNSFNVKKENGALAERMGIVVGTSHCDMLMRSNNREWKPWLAKKGYENVLYDYSIPGRNREILQEYWQESVEQNKDFETCYTLGMRGIHDSGFETSALVYHTPEEEKQAKIQLLSQIIKDQRNILEKTLGRDTMMTFVPYKEVLPLYDGGLEVPEDITLVWSNDNYGYIRRYPSKKEQKRSGGNGIYYHNSYWAPPSMSYVFLCSIPLAHTRNELKKAYEQGIRKLWVLNCGAIKPLEQEITFFLQLAWDIGKETDSTRDVEAWTAQWIDENFQGGIGREAAELLNDFSQLTNVRKLENMDTDAFSQTAYGDEAAVRIHRYEELFDRGNALYEGLQEKEKDAFFQLVLLRIHAAYFTNLQYYYGDRSTLSCTQGKLKAAAEYVGLCRAFDDARRKLIYYYNKKMAGGKWDGILNPEGFPPPRAAMLPACTPPLSLKGREDGKSPMIVTVWNEGESLLFTKPGVKWFEIGNGTDGEFEFEIQAPDFVRLPDFAGEGFAEAYPEADGSRHGIFIVRGRAETEKRILVQVDDVKEDRQGSILVRCLADGSCVEIPVRICQVPTQCKNLEEDGIVCVEADSAASPDFRLVRRLGRGWGNLMEAENFAESTLEGRTPLSYPFYVTSAGEFLLEIHRFPSLDSVGRIRIGVSVDGSSIQIVESESTDEWRGTWKRNVLNNVERLYLKLPYLEPGEHQISFYGVDRYFAFTRFVIYTRERRENHFVGMKGEQSLPRRWNVEAWSREFYGEIDLRPRPIVYAQVEKEEDGLAAAGLVKRDAHYADQVEPEYYFTQGSAVFQEWDGSIRIDAASALALSPYAFTQGEHWKYCSSESYGRSGLAMYIRQPGLVWEGTEEAPSLNYRVRCDGGVYTLWLLAKFNDKEEAFLAAGVDGKPISREHLYGEGCLWRYEAEQIYRYVPLWRQQLSSGEHLLSLYALRSGLRYDRIYLTRGEELPPTDFLWRQEQAWF